MIKYLLCVIFFLIAGCAADSVSGQSGSSCTSCYETTNVNGDPAVTCYSHDGVVCL